MTRISKEPYPTVGEIERKEKFAKIGYSLREHKKTGKLLLVKKADQKRLRIRGK